MAFTVTSPKKTCAVTESPAIFDGPSHGGQGFYVYVNYTKGGESGLKISFLSMDKEVDSTNYFQHVKADGTYALTPLYYTISASGRYRIPVTVSPYEQKLKLLFEVSGGSASGTIEVDIRCGE